MQTSCQFGRRRRAATVSERFFGRHPEARSLTVAARKPVWNSFLVVFYLLACAGVLAAEAVFHFSTAAAACVNACDAAAVVAWSAAALAAAALAAIVRASTWVGAAAAVATAFTAVCCA